MTLRTIPDHPDYSITQDGRVWSTKSNKWLKGDRFWLDDQLVRRASLMARMWPPEGVPFGPHYLMCPDGRIWSTLSHRYVKRVSAP